MEDLIEGVDRFSDLPEKFSLLFDFDGQNLDPEAEEVLKSDCGRRVVTRLAEKMDDLKDFDYNRFAFLAQEIKEETGCKGKDLFHPLRIALTARVSGLKLDRFIPLVEEGAKLLFAKPIKDCFQRVRETRDFMG